MQEIKNMPKLAMVICIISGLLLTLNMYSRQSALVVASFILISCGIVFSKLENKANYLFFFVTWVYVFKLDPEKQTLYTYLILVFVLVNWLIVFKEKKPVNKMLFWQFVLLVAYVILSSLASSNFNLMSNMNFIFNYAIILTFLVANIDVNNNYTKNYIIFYIAGMIFSIISGILGKFLSPISLYLYSIRDKDIIFTKGVLVERFCGLDLDPNYFSVQLLMAISLLLVIIFYEKISLFKLLLLATMVTVGLFSLSKMFFITLGFTLIYVLIVFLKENFIKGIKYSLVVSGLFFAIFLCTYRYVYDAYFQRFFLRTNIENLTTGRSHLWQLYSNHIFGNTKAFFFGEGISNLIDKGAHNIYLCIWYKLGLLGLILFIIFCVNCYRTYSFSSINKKGFDLFNIKLLPLYVMLIANSSLDAFVFNYLPIHILLIILVGSYQNEDILVLKFKEKNIYVIN